MKIDRYFISTAFVTHLMNGLAKAVFMHSIKYLSVLEVKMAV